MADSRHITPTKSFSTLELQVGDLAALAQINGIIFEGIQQSGGPKGNWVCNHSTYVLLSFLVSEFCDRTIRLEKEYADALSALAEQATKAAA